MRHPVFFSFAGDSNEIAARIKGHFADDLVYMYKRTGVDGDSFPVEILNELRECQIFVVFWSAAYVAPDPRRPWCRRELLTAAKRIAQGSLNRFLIIQTDKTPLDTKIINPDTGESIDALEPFRADGRAFSYPFRERSIELRISSELANLDQIDHPILPRPVFEHQLRNALRTGNAHSKTPITFVSGFHGNGRRTLVRSVMGLDFKHLTEYTVSLDSADGPEDLLREIWGDVFQRSISEQRQMMADVKDNPGALREHYSRLWKELVASRSYLVISKDESTDINETVPFWVADIFGSIPPAVQPIAFVIIARGLPEYLQRRMPNIGEVAVPTLEDDQSVELINMLVAAIDPIRAERWYPHIENIAEVGANNPKLLVDIVHMAAKRPSLDFLKRDAAMQASRFDEHVQRAVEWAWEEIKSDQFTVQLLDIINLLGVVHLETLNEIFNEVDQNVGDALYHLIEVGLVEHLMESTYRIPRALARKLNIFVAGKLPRSQTNDHLRRFARGVDVGADEFGGVTLTNRIHAQLATNEPIADEDKVFITASMLFKAGWQRYRLAEYSAALPLLRRAFGTVDRVRDDSTKLEIVRFFGLSAGREHSESDVDAACRFLLREGSFQHRFRMKVRAMERFIRGFALKSDSKFDEALPCYEEALELLPEGGLNDNQRSQLMNEIVQCLLRIEPVNYGRAVALGRRLYRLRETPNNIDVLLRSLLGQTYYDPSASNDVVQQNLVEMAKLEQLLCNKCEGSSLSFYAFRRIDRLEAETVHAVLAGSLPYPSLDLSAVIGSCTDAYLKYGDEALLWRKWDLMLLNEVERNWDSLHLEAAEYLRRGSKNRMGRGNAARIKILTYDLSISENIRIARAELDKFRTDGTLPQSVATDLRRQIDAGDQHNSRVLGKFVNRGLRIN